MSEKTVNIDAFEPVELYGVNDQKLNTIKKYFPKLRIVARGFEMKLMGDASEITCFEQKLKLLSDHYHKAGTLTDASINRLLGQTGDNILEQAVDTGSDIILFGATDPTKAADGTIRKLFAKSIAANAVHGSDSDENAANEASFFFSGLERF